MSTQILSDLLISNVQHLLLADHAKDGSVFAVTVRMDMDDYSKDHDLPSVCAFLHLAVANGGYKKVFAAITDRPVGFAQVNWQLVCSHDSAWRDDGIRSTVGSTYRALQAKAAASFKIDRKALSEHIAIDNMTIAQPDKVFSSIDVLSQQHTRLNFDSI